VKYRYRLKRLLDEFPSLGKMDLFERALGFIGGYGLKSYIIVQGLPQLFKAYGKDESIRVGCHIQVAFAPNDLETCEYLSKSTGQMTILKENYSESLQEGKLFGGNRTLNGKNNNTLTTVTKRVSFSSLRACRRQAW